MDYRQRKILLLDDEREIIDIVYKALRREGFERIYKCFTVAEAYQCVVKEKPELLVLDVMLPDGDGFELMKDIRKHTNVPVVFLTAKDEDYDKLLGLGLGADDYLTKPFLTKELVLRITAILKRVYNKEMEERCCFSLGDKQVDMEQNLVLFGEEAINLTAKERAILLKLYHNRNKVVTSDALCQAVWGDDLSGYEQTLMTHIGRLRKKIELNPAMPEYLITIKGIGYKLIVKERE